MLMLLFMSVKLAYKSSLNDLTSKKNLSITTVLFIMLYLKHNNFLKKKAFNMLYIRRKLFQIIVFYTNTKTLISEYS